MPSYTAIPLTTYQPTPMAIRDAQAAELWEQSLPPSTRLNLAVQMRKLVMSLTPAQRAEIGRYLVQNEIKLPPEVGMGQWAAIAGSLISAAVSTGTQIYVSKQGGKLQENLASQDANTQKQIAQMQSDAAIQAQRIISGATVDAAQQAAGSNVITSRFHMAAMPTMLKWTAATVLGLGLVGAAAWVLTKRKKRA